MNQNTDSTENDHSFGHGIDVSHLATPHVTSSPPHTVRPTPVPTPVCDNTSEDDRGDQTDHSNFDSSAFQQQEPELPLAQPQPSPPSQKPQEPQQQQQQQQQRLIAPSSSSSQSQADNALKEPATKLSYDIISVREPLAKLAERQQIQLSQQHEYIEVYGERGSSCFYEEIAGSTTSSATYDQIGVPSNHNYQVLINAYANRSNGSRIDNEDNDEDETNSNRGNSSNDTPKEDNIYQVENVPSTSDANQSTIHAPIVSQSIPVYSVINKATRRSNAIMRATVDSCCPPQPPPKNLSTHQPPPSAINTYQEPSTIVNTQDITANRSSPQLPSTSSYIGGSNNISESKTYLENHSRLPQPPPRSSRLSMFKATNRPLPLPDKFVDASSSNGLDYDPMRHDDENGYELLTTNFDDDQIDAGYEKIRETNRYSGGSLSSQFCPLQVLDNGGYESVQPIYSSPSNALVEPNYEAIGPATASEIAAAATARLNAAAAVIDHIFKQET